MVDACSSTPPVAPRFSFVGLRMKFSCERCQTRYSIGDEKVKGKVLKIRCKTCGNIIVVREQIPTVQGEASTFNQGREAIAVGQTGSTAPLSATGSMSLPPEASTSTSEQEWYVAIKGKQHGPAKTTEVIRLYKDGRITERTYLWHDQLPSWTRLRDLPEFAATLAEGPPQRRPPPPPPSEEGAEIVNFEAARAQRQNATAIPVNDPFAAMGGSPVGGDGAPRESTRVFIMQAGLHNRAKKQRLYAGVALGVTALLVLLCVVDYQLDILGLKRVVNAVAVTTGIKQQEPIEPGAKWDDVDVDPVLKCKLMPDPAKCVKAEKVKIAKRRIERAKAEGKPISADDLNAAFNSGGESGSGAVAHSGGAAIDENGLIKIDPTLSTDEINRRLGGGKGGPTGPKARVEAPSVAGTTIDAENAGKVVREGQPAIQACVDDAMKQNEDIPSKVRMTLSISTKGVVDKASINEAVVNASNLGACLTRAGKRWKFAPPTEPADLEIPLVLR
jgi:predicted Zn finger-like uncharacterized protein